MFAAAPFMAMYWLTIVFCIGMVWRVTIYGEILRENEAQVAQHLLQLAMQVSPENVIQILRNVYVNQHVSSHHRHSSNAQPILNTTYSTACLLTQ